MLKRIFESILSALGIGAITFVLTALTQIGFADIGKIRLGQIYQTKDGKYEVNIEVINFSKKYVNDLFIKIPKTININDCMLSTPLNISPMAINGTEYSLYSINQIEPSSRNTLIIPLSNKSDIIYFTNYKDKKFTLENTSLLRSPKEETLYIIFLSSLVYIFLLSIQTYIVLTEKYKIKVQCDKDIEKLQKKIEINE